ncbi:MAG: DUF3515 domain-containing protein [Mycolicibacterium sp.]|uniref:DUF3515 domain-containing protein n=1 Tax=Mycolicibacterium sp. TaxID=2320850 RepID=UPI003D0F28DE
MNSQTPDSPPRPMLIAALVVAVAAALAVLVVAALVQRPSAPAPIAIASAPAPNADSPDCDALIAALPERLGDYTRAPVRQPAPAGTAAWQAEDREGAIILRCGLDRPLEFVVGAPLQVVDAVQWFRVTDQASEGRSTWFAVDRPVYVALTLPTGSGPTPIQAISEAVSASLPAGPLDPAPAR